MKNFYRVLFFILLVANFFIYQAILAPHVLKVTALEVGPPAGGGSATLVQTSSGETILIDTGPDASILRALGTALPPWQRTITAVILTGTKKSVVGGLNDVLSRYNVSQQLSLTKSQRLTLGDNSYIDIVLSPNAATSISVFNDQTVTKITQ